MNPILKIAKIHPDATLPTFAKLDDAGMDLTAIDDGTLSPDGRHIEYRTGIAIELPYDHHALLHPRSSISKYDLLLCNSIGLVDQGYRGELVCRFKIVPPVKLERMRVGDTSTCQAFVRYSGVGATISGTGEPNWTPKLYRKGDRIAQIVIAQTPKVSIEYGEISTDTQRSTGGFGSSGS